MSCAVRDVTTEFIERTFQKHVTAAKRQVISSFGRPTAGTRVTGGVLGNMTPVKSAAKHATAAKRVKLQPITKVLPNAGNYVIGVNRGIGFCTLR